MFLLCLTSERSPFYLPLGWCWFLAMVVEARHEQESSLPLREWKCGEMCVMRWENVRNIWIKT